MRWSSPCGSSRNGGGTIFVWCFSTVVACGEGGGVTHGPIANPPPAMVDAGKQTDAGEQVQTDANVPLCSSNAIPSLPGYMSLSPGDPKNPMPTGEGRGTVVSRDANYLVIEGEDCCPLQLQRADGMPPLAEVGEELEFAFWRGGTFNSPEWGFMLRTPEGNLRFLGYAGFFSDTRYELLHSPLRIDLSLACKGADSSCYSQTYRLDVTIASDSDQLVLTTGERGTIQLDRNGYQVLNYGANRSGEATGDCTNSRPPGDDLRLIILPADIPLP